jgi:integrase
MATMVTQKHSQTFYENLKARGLHSDGGGLYLQVGKGGRTKSWIFRYARNGHERHMGLGSFDTWNAKQAREKATRCRQMLDEGIDPIEQRKAQRHEQTLAARLAAKKDVTFRECAEMYLADQDWKLGTMAHARRQIPRFLYPKLGEMPVSSIGVDHVEQVIKPILDKKQNSTTRQILMFLKSILDFAEAHSFRAPGDNPARGKGPLGVRVPRLKAVRKREGEKKNPALDFKRIGEFMAALRAFRCQHWLGKTPIPARALELLALTGVRVEMVTSLPWNEIKWEERLWVCPKERHKTGRKTKQPYKVPLIDQAIAVLKEMQKLQQDAGLYREDGFVFLHGPSTDYRLHREVHARAAGNPIHKNSVWMFLKEAEGEHGWKDKDGNRISPKDGWLANDKRRISVHGFRATFSTWASENTEKHYDERDIETALGHVIGNTERNKYKDDVHIHRIPTRRPMMQHWANVCDRTEELPDNIERPSFRSA